MTFSYLWQYLAKCFVQWKVFRITVVEKVKIQNLCPITLPPPPENRAVYNTLPKNLVEPERLQMTIWRRVLCWIGLHAGKHTLAPVQPHAHTHTYVLTCTHAHARAHTQTCNAYRFSTTTVISLTYIPFLVFLNCVNRFIFLYGEALCFLRSRNERFIII
jgi:hypothetical protein